jgi:hypothetical protein
MIGTGPEMPAAVVRLRRGADLMHDTAQVVEALVADYDQPHALRRVPM